MTTHILTVAAAGLLLGLTVGAAASRHQRARTNPWPLSASIVFALLGLVTALTGPGHGLSSTLYTSLASLYLTVAYLLGRRRPVEAARTPRKQLTEGSED